MCGQLPSLAVGREDGREWREHLMGLGKGGGSFVRPLYRGWFEDVILMGRLSS